MPRKRSIDWKPPPAYKSFDGVRYKKEASFQRKQQALNAAKRKRSRHPSIRARVVPYKGSTGQTRYAVYVKRP